MIASLYVHKLVIYSNGFAMKKNTSIIAAIITALGGIIAASISLLPHADKIMPNFWSLLNPKGVQQETAITFTIQNTLGINQLNEAVTITINSKPVGKLVVDTQNPHSFLQVTVPRAGQQSYTISSVANFLGSNNQFYGTGQGFIDISGKETFVLVTAFNGSQGIVSLQKK